MGIIINGRWTEEETIHHKGEYTRQTSVFHNDISDDIVLGISEQPGRFHFIASWTCPWSHGVMLFRQLKRLAEHIPMHVTGGKRIQGYPANFGDVWSVPGSNVNIEHLHQLYSLSDPTYTGRSTIPVLWDSLTQTIISNESTKMIQAFEKTSLNLKSTKHSFLLRPPQLEQKIESLNQDIYTNLLNGVYRAGFAQNQHAYSVAVTDVFSCMDRLEVLLSKQRYLLGSIVTESDWRLFPCLVRFDIDYFIHSRCSYKRLLDYPNLWAYARDIYQWQGIASTVNFDAIHRSNYVDDDILAIAPQADWILPHERDKFSEAQVVLANKEIVNIDPKTLVLRNKNTGKSEP